MTLPDQTSPRDQGQGDAFSPPSRLPAPLSSLIGRERELQLVCDLLQRDGVRLVTLTGPGGVGKTRLAHAVAAALEPGFPDGVAFVSLETVRDPDEFLAALAAAHGIGEGARTSRYFRLLNRMRDRQSLLLLDNFEQILDAGADLARILEASPGTRAIVTSRVVLRVSGEHDVPLEPLAVPAEDAVADVQASEAAPSVRLFLERAVAHDPSWKVADPDISVIAEICRRLDGLPLAIELAAARVNVLSLTGIRSRLEQRLPLLVGGSRDLPERLQTMRSAISWSSRLLLPAERVLFHRLSVFVGGWTLDEAIALCRDADEMAVINGVGRLVDSSLVRSWDVNGGRRFAMLETVREFASELLAGSGEERSIRERHAEVMIDVAERFSRELMTGRVAPELLQAAEAEAPNVRAALRWWEDAGRNEEVLRLAATIAPFWLFEGRLIEGTRILESALAGCPEGPREIRARALRHLGMLYRPLGKEARATECLEESLSLEQDGHPLQVATTMNFLGIVLLGTGAYDRAERAWEGAMARFRQVEEGDVWIDHVLHHQGLLRFGQGRKEDAIELLEQTLERYRSHGDPRGEASSLVALALIDCGNGDIARARTRLALALDIWESLGMLEGLAGCFATAVVFAHALQRYRDAARYYGVARRVCEVNDSAFSLPESAIYDKVYADLRERLSDTAWHDAFSEGHACSVADAVRDIRLFLADTEPAPTAVESFGLSPREVQVLELVTRGATDREIADDLYVSLRTAQTHVSHILRKLDVRSRSEASAVAVRHDLV